MISVVIPANNEEAYIGACLGALLAQDTARPVEVIVAANGCSDRTVEIARALAPRFADRGWRLEVLDIARGGKPGALNRADAVATGDMRVYLDADVTMSAALLEGLARALERPGAAYASGRLELAPARSALTRAYGRIWRRLPFMTEGVPGAGLFAVNAAGRARWGEFPAIISDDTYVRLQFSPHERIGVPAGYRWPLVEGLAALVRVRRRQDQGVREVAAQFPALMANEGKGRLGGGGLARLALTDPPGFAVYGLVVLLARLTRRAPATWSRGR